MPTRTPSISSSSSRPPRPALPPISTTIVTPSTSHSNTIADAASFRTLFQEPASATTTATATAPSSVVAAGGPTLSATTTTRDAIEMEPIVTGHRRRKSSLMNPINTLSSSTIASSSRPRPQGSTLTSPLPIGPGSLSSAASSVPEQLPSAEMLQQPFHGAGGSPTPTTATSVRYDGDSDSYSDNDLRDDEETGLTRKQRKNRQKRRRRNTLLDQRIVPDEKNLGNEDETHVDRDVVKRISVNLGLIFLWYLFSLSISLYNKWMFDEDRLNFAFPLFTTSMHMIVQFALSGLVLYLVPSLRPKPAHESDMGRSRHEAEPASGSNSSGSPVGLLFYLTRIGPCGMSTGLDIGLGNTSLKFISLTFYTMCKSSSLAFVLLFAFLFRLETPTWRLVAIIATMTIGVILMVFGEIQFKLGGFVLIISAAFFSGLRWGLTQILLLRHPATSNPFASIFLLTPVMFVTLLSLAFPVEGFWPLIEGLHTLSDEWGAIYTPLFLLFPGCLAFLMTSAEFALLQRTSVVTLSIAGIFKEVVTISAASVLFEESLTLINLVGLFTTMAAIVAYNYIKITKMRTDARAGEATAADYQRASLSSPGHSSGDDTDNDYEGYAETAGLLRQSVDGPDGTLIMADGDIQPNLIIPASPIDEHTR
ncbi:solute carrier family 35, member C2 [Geosmithia morbida]|uniref:Solute carrier family 35, member C2 n=1 Tax=Geosmithia morbida TaxID=1094350 RepID=A0A9P4YTE1_9HYPO|nr:solute carrier family 35, member C2 [Geosmithia morbida]KAF4122460.1 solute carrier family 35, member C2 [Geosmithia morbida]